MKKDGMKFHDCHKSSCKKGLVAMVHISEMYFLNILNGSPTVSFFFLASQLKAVVLDPCCAFSDGSNSHDSKFYQVSSI